MPRGGLFCWLCAVLQHTSYCVASFRTASSGVTYSSLVKLLTDYYNPKPSPIVQRFHFNRRLRGHCICRCSSRPCSPLQLWDRLQEMLRDRLICGVNHKGLQWKLLVEADLTYGCAYSLALAAEALERDVEALQPTTTATSVKTPAGTPLTVHHVSPPAHSSFCATPPILRSSSSTDKDSNPLIVCYRCGGPHSLGVASILTTLAPFTTTCSWTLILHVDGLKHVSCHQSLLPKLSNSYESSSPHTVSRVKSLLIMVLCLQATNFVPFFYTMT